MHSSLRPGRRRCEASRSIFRAELTEEMCNVYDFLSHCFLPQTFPLRWELWAVAEPTTPSLSCSTPCLFIFIFLEIDKQGVRDA